MTNNIMITTMMMMVMIFLLPLKMRTFKKNDNLLKSAIRQTKCVHQNEILDEIGLTDKIRVSDFVLLSVFVFFSFHSPEEITLRIVNVWNCNIL